MSNIMWHVALDPGTTGMQDVILAALDVNDLETIGLLLSTSRLKGKVLETERGSYLLMYGGEYGRPYPGVIIWRIEIAEDESFITDIRQEDGWVVEHIWRVADAGGHGCTVCSAGAYCGDAVPFFRHPISYPVDVMKVA